MSFSAAVGPLPVQVPGAGEFSAQLIYSPGVYRLIEYGFAFAGFALFAGALYAFVGRNEVSGKYRTAVFGSALLQAVAALAYLGLWSSWRNGFVFLEGVYVPVLTDPFDGALRYADWSVTVPLLGVELLAVTALVGAALARARIIAIVSGFFMIITGYFGAYVFFDGTSTLWLNVWAAVSTVFLVIFYLVLGRAVLDSRRHLSDPVHRSLMRSTILLFSIFGAYPLLYAVQVIVGPQSNLVAWAVVVQLGFSFSDVVAKVGFGVMIHRIGKLRTAEDVLAGNDTIDEPVYVANELKAQARPAGADAPVGANGQATSVVR